jgi:hypothetical protein
MILDRQLLKIHPEWNEKCKWFNHIQKFWFYDNINKKNQYECALCELHINARSRLEKIMIDQHL